MNNPPDQKDPINRYEEGLSELEKRICPIWQGWQDEYRTRILAGPC